MFVHANVYVLAHLYLSISMFVFGKVTLKPYEEHGTTMSGMIGAAALSGKGIR